MLAPAWPGPIGRCLCCMKPDEPHITLGLPKSVDNQPRGTLHAAVCPHCLLGLFAKGYTPADVA